MDTRRVAEKIIDLPHKVREIIGEFVSDEEIDIVLLSFTKLFVRRLKECSSSIGTLLKKYKGWVDDSLVFNKIIINRARIGRPSKEFGDLSQSSKRRRTHSLRKGHSLAELSSAVASSYRTRGQRDRANKLNHIDDLQSPNTTGVFVKMSTLEAVQLLVRGKFSKRQYNLIRSSLPAFFPSYKTVQRGKSTCYPEGVTATDSQCEVPLANLLDHTSKRIIESLGDTIGDDLVDQQVLTLTVKWGMDGSGGLSNFKQAGNSLGNDGSVFMSALVPLKLVSTDPQVPLWSNPKPSSSLWCRPIRFQYVKETAEVTKAERDYIKKQFSDMIDNPTPIKISDNKTVFIKYVDYLTMLDGKVSNVLSECSYSAKCNICLLSGKQFNDLEAVAEAINDYVIEDNFQYGLSTLHTWIRSLEWILHLSYKLDAKKWGVKRTEEEKQREVIRKTAIQDEFKRELHLLVDMVSHGFGSSNDGNTARGVFRKFAKSADILEIDERIVKGLFILCQVLNSHSRINVIKFKQFCDYFSKLYVELYPWYPIPPSLHKILAHGNLVIDSFDIPIGQLSEEAMEASHKHFKDFRQNHSRKFSRVATNADVMNWLLLASDPLINSNRMYIDCKYDDYLPEVCDILDLNEEE